MLVNKHSDLTAIDLLTGVDVIGTLGMSYVTPYVVYTIAESRLSLRFFWSSHLPAC